MCGQRTWRNGVQTINPYQHSTLSHHLPPLKLVTGIVCRCNSVQGDECTIGVPLAIALFAGYRHPGQRALAGGIRIYFFLFLLRTKSVTSIPPTNDKICSSILRCPNLRGACRSAFGPASGPGPLAGPKADRP